MEKPSQRKTLKEKCLPKYLRSGRACLGEKPSHKKLVESV